MPQYYFMKQPVSGKPKWLHMPFSTKKSAMNMLPQIVMDEPEGTRLALIKVCKQFVVDGGKAIETKEA